MKLLFKQRLFSWLATYDIYGENWETVYTVKGKLAWGHCLMIFDANGNHLGRIQQRIISFLPRFDIYLGEDHIGCITKEFSFLKPRFSIDCNGWRVVGDFLEWDYSILSSDGQGIATVSKQIWKLTDTYIIDVADPKDALKVLMLVLAIDAEKSSRN